MKLYPYRWDLEGGKTIKKVKQFYKDLFSSSCEDYWSDEGNNKRMQNYHKLSITLKYIKYLLILGLIIYGVYLSTNTIFCLFDKMICCDNDMILLSLINIKKFVFNTYIMTFVIFLFLVVYFSRRRKLNLKQILKLILVSLTFLPMSALLNYNFMILGSLMCSFYLVVIITVVMLSIDFLTKRIDGLYKIAVEGKVVKEVDMNRKGDKKCKKK